jgi:hypothetical protein
MKLKIITLNGEKRMIECDFFEFRSNQVSNWIKICDNGCTEIIHNVAVIKSVSGSKER